MSSDKTTEKKIFLYYTGLPPGAPRSREAGDPLKNFFFF
jgi:hypothetical protein